VWSRLSTQQDNPAAAGLTRGMGAIIENDEDEDDEYSASSASSQNSKLKPDDVPQAFSHFSFTVTNDIDLCCDLQVRRLPMPLSPGRNGKNPTRVSEGPWCCIYRASTVSPVD